jgi:hypothetical protein
MVALPVPVRWHWLKSKNPQIRSGGFFRVFRVFFGGRARQRLTAAATA